MTVTVKKVLSGPIHAWSSAPDVIVLCLFNKTKKKEKKYHREIFSHPLQNLAKWAKKLKKYKSVPCTTNPKRIINKKKLRRKNLEECIVPHVPEKNCVKVPHQNVGLGKIISW